MTTHERALVEEALDYLHQLPSGISPWDVVPGDLLLDDDEFHIGSLAARCLIEALNEEVREDANTRAAEKCL